MIRTATLSLLLVPPVLVFAQGFPTAPTNWGLPSGGEVDGGIVQGFMTLSDYGTDVGSDTWSTIDINGDAKPDLVCTGTRASNGYVTEFSPSSNSYWKVYLNTGSGFSSNATTWSLPSGGEVDGGIVQGFMTLSDYGTDVGSDTWSTIDINADDKPDLVCTGTRASNGYVTEFSPSSNSYWKVYYNTGAGFSSSATNWGLPSGGEVDGGIVQGFMNLSDYGSDVGSDTWSTIDLNGDGNVDLVCTGTRAANGYVTEFSPSSNSYWKAYIAPSTAGVVEVAESMGIELFPNPASDRVQVRTTEHMEQVELLDATGALIHREQPRSLSAQLDVGALPHGVYLVRISAAGQVATRRLVVGAR